MLNITQVFSHLIAEFTPCFITQTDISCLSTISVLESGSVTKKMVS